MNPCLFCDEPIIGTDRRYQYENGPWAHWDCHIRSIMGSVGHLQGKCSCYGGAEGDPPGMTRREAARAAREEFDRIFKEAQQK